MRRALRTLVMTSRGSADQAASLVSIHRRTLNRRLNRHGTTFKELLDEVRFEPAHQLFGDTLMPVAEVAAALNYSDASAFHPRLPALDRHDALGLATGGGFGQPIRRQFSIALSPIANGMSRNGKRDRGVTA
jgi:AraC-like DNA-binding protein